MSELAKSVLATIRECYRITTDVLDPVDYRAVLEELEAEFRELLAWMNSDDEDEEP